jgi:hypothetical protein
VVRVKDLGRAVVVSASCLSWSNAGAQVTCFTGAKVPILTPDKLFASNNLVRGYVHTRGPRIPCHARAVSTGSLGVRHERGWAKETKDDCVVGHNVLVLVVLVLVLKVMKWAGRVGFVEK